MNPHFQLLDHACRELSVLDKRFVFVGGATVSLHIDDPAAGPVRATKDVDLVVEVTGYADYAALEAQLRQIGFEQDLGDDDAPICRWAKNDLLIDMIPTEPEILTFSGSRWFREGFIQAQSYDLPGGRTVEAFGPLHLMAAKIDAFKDRGEGDWLLSSDIQDLATIVDGRTTIFNELLADDEVATFVRCWLRANADHILDAIADAAGSYERANFLRGQLSSLEG